MVDDPLLIIINDADRIAFTRCCNKLRLIDRELSHIAHVHIRTYKHESDILFEVHDSHQAAAIYHILSAIQDADQFARRIRDKGLRIELQEDVAIRRLSWYDLFDPGESPE
jgi:hypothetical protein